MAKAELTQCLKFKRLMRRLPECSRPLLIGHLDLMWQTAWAGKVVAFPCAEDAEVAAEWAGEPGQLSAALLDLRWLVHSELGLEIKDWWEHAPDFVRRRKPMLEIALRRAYKIPEDWLRARNLRSTTGAPPAGEDHKTGTQRVTGGLPVGYREATDGLPTVPKREPNGPQDPTQPGSRPESARAGLEGGGLGEGGKGATVAQKPPAGAGGSALPDLELTPPDGETAPRGQIGRRRGRVANPEVPKLIRHYETEFERTQGATPLIQEADGIAAARVLRGRTYDQAAALVTKFLEQPDKWTKSHGLLRLRDLPAAVTRILARASPSGRPAPGGEGRDFSDVKDDFVIGEDDGGTDQVQPHTTR